MMILSGQKLRRIGNIYKQGSIYYEYLGSDKYIVYSKDFDPEYSLLVVSTVGINLIEIPKNDKDFLKVKEEVINKIKIYENSQKYLKVKNCIFNCIK